MELSQAIYGRRAVRAYLPDAIDQPVIEALIDAAVQAPSAINEQPWAFCVVREAALLDRISREAKAHMLRTTPAGLAGHHFEAMLADENFHIFYHAPALVVICAAQASAWSSIDCTLAAQNLMLAAHDQGLGTCWIGFAQSWLSTEAGHSALDIPAQWSVIAPIIVGRPQGSVEAPARRKPQIHWTG